MQEGYEGMQEVEILPHSRGRAFPGFQSSGGIWRSKKNPPDIHREDLLSF